MYSKIGFIILLAFGCAVARNLNVTDISSNDLAEDDSSNSYEEDDVFNGTSSCTLTAFPPNPDSGCCGIDTTSHINILGGEPTLLTQYPWLALLHYIRKQDNAIWIGCGGSLISGRYVLTAAHCFCEDILEVFTLNSVVLGDYDKNQDGPDCVTAHNVTQCTEGEVRIGVEKVFQHLHYSPRNHSNDIALVRLNTTAPFTDTIRPICLPTVDLNTLDREDIWLYVAGWGTWRQENPEPGKYENIMSHIKRHLAVPFVKLSKCGPWTNVDKELITQTPQQICAGGVEGKNACKGDSGGPLMHENDGLFELSGIVSYGVSRPCGQKNVAEVYTNVYQYMGWIVRHIIVE